MADLPDDFFDDFFDQDFFDEQLIEFEGEDDDEEETEYEEEGDEEEEDETEEEQEENVAVEDVIYVPAEYSPSHAVPVTVDVEEEEERGERRWRDGTGGRGGEGQLCSSSQDGRSDTQGSQWNRSGLFCPICLEAGTTGGEHHVCCLPCGHLYGFSCINRWTQQKGGSGKCPQCNRKYKLKDVRKLFAPPIAAVDEESQNRIQHLEEKVADCRRKMVELTQKMSTFCQYQLQCTNAMKQMYDQFANYYGIHECSRVHCPVYQASVNDEQNVKNTATVNEGDDAMDTEGGEQGQGESEAADAAVDDEGEQDADLDGGQGDA